MRKLFLVFLLASCATARPESDVLDELQPVIAEMQQGIANDISSALENDADYKRCVAENDILRDIARKHTEKHPDNEFAPWSTPDICKKLSQIETQHDISSFFSGFYYSDLGKCVAKIPDTFQYQRKIWEYCDNNYDEKDWKTCSDLLSNNIIVNGKQVLSFYDPIQITDDLSPGMSMGYSGKKLGSGRSLWRDVFELSESEKYRYIFDAPEYDVFEMSDTVTRISVVDLDCHRKDGRLKKWRIEQFYNRCKEMSVDISVKSHATFCKCVATNAYEYSYKTNQKLNSIDFDVAAEKLYKQFDECLDMANK